MRFEILADGRPALIPETAEDKAYLESLGFLAGGDTCLLVRQDSHVDGTLSSCIFVFNNEILDRYVYNPPNGALIEGHQ